MKGYVVIDNEVIDQEAFSDFVGPVAEALAAHGGRFIVRGGNVAVLEGDWSPQRLVIMEFDSRDAAVAFIESDDFRSLDDVRHRALTSQLVVVDGYAAEA